MQIQFGVSGRERKLDVKMVFPQALGLRSALSPVNPSTNSGSKPSFGCRVPIHSSQRDAMSSRGDPQTGRSTNDCFTNSSCILQMASAISQRLETSWIISSSASTCDFQSQQVNHSPTPIWIENHVCILNTYYNLRTNCSKFTSWISTRSQTTHLEHGHIYMYVLGICIHKGPSNIEMERAVLLVDFSRPGAVKELKKHACFEV